MHTCSHCNFQTKEKHRKIIISDVKWKLQKSLAVRSFSAVGKNCSTLKWQFYVIYLVIITAFCFKKNISIAKVRFVPPLNVHCLFFACFHYPVVVVISFRFSIMRWHLYFYAFRLTVFSLCVCFVVPFRFSVSNEH